jgi:hypothetical protein
LLKIIGFFFENGGSFPNKILPNHAFSTENRPIWPIGKVQISPVLLEFCSIDVREVWILQGILFFREEDFALQSALEA